eukprot:2992863-Rhodomonas_salina.1
MPMSRKWRQQVWLEQSGGLRLRRMRMSVPFTQVGAPQKQSLLARLHASRSLGPWSSFFAAAPYAALCSTCDAVGAQVHALCVKLLPVNTLCVLQCVRVPYFSGSCPFVQSPASHCFCLVSISHDFWPPSWFAVWFAVVFYLCRRTPVLSRPSLTVAVHLHLTCQVLWEPPQRIPEQRQVRGSNAGDSVRVLLLSASCLCAFSVLSSPFLMRGVVVSCGWVGDIGPRSVGVGIESGVLTNQLHTVHTLSRPVA